MGLDYAFWKAGEGSAEEIYTDLGDGDSSRLAGDEDVLCFRELLLAGWPELEESIEPYDAAPRVEAAEFSKYVVINIHAADVARMYEVWRLAEQCGLVAYDPLHCPQ
jgi:hypothetical protein